MSIFLGMQERTPRRHGGVPPNFRPYPLGAQALGYAPSAFVGPIGQPLIVRLGAAALAGGDGRFFRLKGPGGDVLAAARLDMWEGAIASWRRLGVLAGTRVSARFFVLEPGERDDVLLFEDFFVKGRFCVVTREGDAERARAALRAFSGS